MEIYEKIDIVDERIQFWQNCITSVQNDINKLQTNIPLNEDNGNKEINVGQRILDGLAYIDICNNKIAYLMQERQALTNQG